MYEKNVFTAEAQSAQRKNKNIESDVMESENYDEITGKIIKCAIEVHKNLGAGLLESVYAKCLEYEFKENGIRYKREVEIPVNYKGMNIECSFRADFIVEDKVIIELKSVDKLIPVFNAQLLTYLKITGKKIGIIINFNEELLKNGIKRMINSY